MAPSATWSATCRGCARWGSTCCISRRSSPIGRTNRKGPNNTLTPAEGDPGSPYAIGSADGGHDALHPELGTLEDFRHLVAAAAEHGLEIAIDFAIQCSPDHPWLKQHRDWFDWRPDGSIKYAENPPKKYQDIVNVDFYAAGVGARAVGGAGRRRDVLDGAGRPLRPRRQPAHQAAAVLAVDDRLGAGALPGRRVPGRGVHPAEGDVPPGEGRLQPVLHLLHLARDQARDGGLPDGAGRARSAGVLPPAFLRQHAGHQPGLPAGRRPRPPT